MNEDRVGDVYDGAAGYPAAQARTRRRIHWMCGQVTGADVLDVGCSQGIAAILLGREGKHVVGVERESGALEDARGRLEAEDASVAERVHLVEATAGDLPFANDSFDTVLLGEVLEHQVLPQGCIDEASRVLRDGGRCVITVPYGLLPFHDHKEPLYLQPLLQMLSGFAVERIELIDRYVGLACTPTAAEHVEPSGPLVKTALGIAERRLARVDVELEGDRTAARERREGLTLRLESTAEAESALREELAAVREKLARVETLAVGRGQLARKRAAELGKVKARAQAERKEARRLAREVKRLRASKALRLARVAGLVSIRRPLRRRERAPEPEPEAEPAQEEAVQPPIGSSAESRGPGDSSSGVDVGVTRSGESAPEPAAPAGEVRVDRERERALSALRARPTDLVELEVAAVMDEMSAACFGPECRLRRIGSDDWRERLEGRRPDLLIVESAWAGNTGSWQYQVASYAHPDSIGLPNLTELVEWCRREEVPTVFWNKEDPVHFNRFKDASSLFDHVFTTDERCLERYRELRPDRPGRVETLPFAAQPKIHNPVAPSSPRRSAPCFAGTYYRDRHPARRQDLEMLLDAARPFGLVIYDRRHGSPSAAVGFPERFLEHVEGGLTYEDTLSAYKSFELFLNVNSVVDSPSMFSRRVFELLACDTPVVSTPSVGLERTFGDLVPTVENGESARNAIERLLSDGERRKAVADAGRRLVLGEHTYRHRLAAVAEALGHRVDLDARERVAALVMVDEPDALTALEYEGLAAEDGAAMPSETLVGVVGGAPSTDDVERRLPAGLRAKRIRIVDQDADVPAAERWRDLARLATAPWVAFIRPGHRYRPRHLSDLILASRFAAAEVIGSALVRPSSSNGAAPEQLYVEAVHPDSAIARREVIAVRGWPGTPSEAAEVMSRWHREGVRLYGAEADLSDESRRG